MTLADSDRAVSPFIAYGLRPLAGNALEVTHPAGLSLIRRDDLNLVIWRRDDAPDLSSLLTVTPDSREAGPLDPAVMFRAETLGRDVAAFLAARYALNAPAVMELAVDMFELAAHLMQVAGEAAVRPRFERIAHAGCRLLHADRVRLRLLCAYTGRGTQWVPDALADRTRLGTGNNTAVLRKRHAVRTVPRGSIALLKGDVWPGNAGRGVIHRSPPPAGADRLLLTLDLIGR